MTDTKLDKLSKNALHAATLTVADIFSSGGCEMPSPEIVARAAIEAYLEERDAAVDRAFARFRQDYPK